MSRFGWLLVVVVIFLCLPGGARAAGKDWRIDRFYSDVKVQSDGTVNVAETIDVTFTSAKHGIFRDIPYMYQADGKTTYTSVAGWNVQRDGHNEPYTVSQQDGFEELKIGDSSVTVTGSHTYIITYVATGVLRGFKGYDELYWNVTGSGWPVSIEQASATVSLPHPAILQTSCYEGVEGSASSCQSLTVDPLQARFSTNQPLVAGTGLTLAVGYTKGIVPLLTVEKPQTIADKFRQAATQPLFIGSMVLGLLLGLALPVGLWWRKGRDWSWQQSGLLMADQRATLTHGNKQPLVVEFTPPLDLRPAQVGLLLDERVDTLDISSTIVDLACRGYLKITELEKTWILGSKDYQLDRTKKPIDDLLPYEQLVLNKLFEGKYTIKLSSLKNTFYDKLPEIQRAVYQNLMDLNYFVANPQAIRTRYFSLGVVVTILGIGSLFYVITMEMIAWFPYALVPLAAGVGLLLLASSMSQRTAEGADMQRRVLGYRLFIATAEQYRQQFFEKENLFNEVLPYAMVFGLTHKFAQAMKVIGYEPSQPTWYSGTSAFNVLAFSSGMSAMSRALATTMASTPSSSGSGGGGFSGGGFGGGGGGSW